MNHTTNPQDARAELSAKLWQIAEQHIIAEWICCEPCEPKHELCAKGYAALAMARTLLVDDPGAARSAPLLDAVIGMLPAALPSVVVSADRATLRAAVVEVLRPHASLGGTPPRYEVPLLDGANPRLPRISGWKALDDVADAVLAVLPDQAEWDALCREAGRLRRASAEMAERAERIEAEVRQVRADRATLLRAADWFDSGVRSVTMLFGHQAATELRRMADQADADASRVAAGEQPTETQDAGPACTPDRAALRDRVAAAVDEGFRLYAELEDLSLGASITDSVMAALDAVRPAVVEQPDTQTREA